MRTTADSMTSSVEAMYREARADLDFKTVFAAFNFESDADLADLVEVDGRTRLALGRPVELQRYLASIPGLHSHEMALDAAIDVSLRQLAGGSRPTRAAVESLCQAYPQFRGAIEDAALLAEAVVSTTGVSRIVRSAPQREVPCDFGPTIEDGHRRFRLVKPLGSGSAGEVYLAEDRQLSESDLPAMVAIKVLAPHGRGTRARQQLIEEASKARRVLHDNVVRVLDRGVSDENEDYIVYEHIDSGTVEDWFERRLRRVTAREAAAVVVGIARGLQAAHSAGLLHCDLKPSNILMTLEELPKVADFGIAVRESDLATKRPAANRPIGNIAFISPEQYLGKESALTVASDIYALGGVLYYLLTGTLPNGATVEEIAATHHPVHGRKAPPTPVGHGIDQDLVAVCQRALSLDPTARHSSAAAMADDLQCWLNHEPVSWTKPSIWKMTQLAARRKPLAAGGLIVAIASLIAGTAAGGYWASVALRNERETTAVRGRMSTANKELGSVIDTLKRLGLAGIGQDLIPITVALEGLYGNAVLGSPEDREKLWAERIGTVRSIINDYTAAGRHNQVETLLWEAVLGFWLINNGKFADAEKVLIPSAAKWAAKGMADDPLAAQVRRLAASATVNRLSAASKSRPLQVEELAELAKLEPVLQAGLLPAPPGGTPTRLRTLEAMALLYEPAMLNSPDKLKEASFKLKRHLEGLEAQKFKSLTRPKLPS